MKALAPPLLLILAVLGSILAGIATPTESASVGAVGAMLLSAANRSFSLPILREVMRTTLTISSMVFVILLGASVFSLVFRGLGGENLVHEALSSLPGGTFSAVLAVMLVIFFLGFFLDTFEIIFVVVPIAAPALIKLGVDPVWLGVMIGVNLQTSFLTPPFGFALFYLRGVAGKMLKTIEIYQGVVPFVALQVLGLGLLWALPAWRPTCRTGCSGTRRRWPRMPGPSAPAAPSGSPVADDFGDLFDGARGGSPPYLDNLEDLVPEDGDVKNRERSTAADGNHVVQRDCSAAFPLLFQLELERQPSRIEERLLADSRPRNDVLPERQEVLDDATDDPVRRRVSGMDFVQHLAGLRAAGHQHVFRQARTITP